MTEGEGFRSNWRAEVLAGAPLIAPARQFVYPQQIPGEEDALARGALRVMVQPGAGGSFLATFALGFSDGRLPTGVWACPRNEEMCALAGGYAYFVDTSKPELVTLLAMRPVVEVLAATDADVLVLVGLHGLTAWGAGGLAWETGRLSWEGVRVTGVDGAGVRGFGWDLHTDREVEFRVDLTTGAHTGGAFAAGASGAGARIS